MATPLSLPMASLSLRSKTSRHSLSFSHSEAFSRTSISLLSPSAYTTAAAPPPLSLVFCGRGDKKTAKGKRFKHSFGNSRPRNKKKGRGPPRIPIPPPPRSDDPFDDGGEKVNFATDESLSS